MKIKGFLCLILTIAMLMGMCSFSVQAAFDFMIYYSLDKETWIQIPEFSLAKRDYVVNLPDNTWHVYMKYEKIDGPTNHDVRNSGETDKNSYVYTITGDLKAPNFPVTRIQSAFVKYGQECLVPIKGGSAETWTRNTDSEGKGIEYGVVFNSKQPKITQYTSNIGTFGMTSFIGGGQVYNDNRTLIDSVTPVDSGNIWALGNVSKKLLSSSALLLPISAFENSACSEVTYPNLATFETDTPCRVYVMRPSAVTTSAYNTWETLNNGTQGIASGSEFTTPRNDNSYTNTDYYGIAYKWVCDNNVFKSKAEKMLVSPGINGNITNEDVLAISHLKYVYSKSFSAGETITIGNPGGLGGSEASALMTVLIQWEFPEPVVTIEDIYAVSDAVNDEDCLIISTNMSIGYTKPNAQFKTIVALYNTNEDLLSLKIQDFELNDNEYTIMGSYPEDTQIKIFVLGMGALKPALYNSSYTLSDILLQ